MLCLHHNRTSPIKGLFIAFFLLIAGCATHKGSLKGEVHETSAMKRFKEGAELLYVDNQAALSKFDEVQRLEPEFIPAYYNAGVACEALGNLLEASKRYEACLSKKKDQPNCLFNELLVKAKLGELDAANAMAQAYLTEFPESPFAQSAAANLAFYQKDYARAEKLAREALERDAENVEALLVMARIFYERKEYAAAKWVAKNALEIAPSHGGFHLLLGHTEQALDLLHDALDSYALAVQNQPTDEALESYGLLLLKRGRAAEALQVMSNLATMRPDVYGYQLHLGNALIANKKFDEAKAAFLKAQALKPDDKDINLNLGLLFYDLKPQGLSELERLKAAEGYFKAYLDQPSVSKDRLKEVHDYLEIIKQKIELEEYKASSAQEPEQPEAESVGEKPEAGEEALEPNKNQPQETAPSNLEALEPSHEESESAAKPVDLKQDKGQPEDKKKKPKVQEKTPEVLPEEEVLDEEDIFLD